MKDLEHLLLTKCIEVVAQHTSEDEAIIQIRKGRTLPGKQVFHVYRIDVATPDVTLSDAPKNRRCLIVRINQDSPDTASVELCAWQPWDYVYYG
jgi:hypothetical protein